jgi:hypothetical protein
MHKDRRVERYSNETFVSFLVLSIIALRFIFEILYSLSTIEQSSFLSKEHMRLDLEIFMTLPNPLRINDISYRSTQYSLIAQDRASSLLVVRTIVCITEWKYLFKKI